VTCRLIFSLSVQRPNPSHSYHAQHTAFSLITTCSHFNILPVGPCGNKISTNKISLVVHTLAQIFSDEANQRLQIALCFGIATEHSGSIQEAHHTSTVAELPDCLLWSQIQAIWLFSTLVDVTKFICLCGFFVDFCMIKLSARNLHTILFLNHVPLRKVFLGQLHLAIFLPPRVWASGRQAPTGKSAEHGGRMTGSGTVA